MNRQLAGCSLLVIVLTAGICLARAGLATQQEPRQFGGGYTSMDARRQKFVDNWVARFNEVTGRQFQPAEFYDTFARLSVRTTFDAVTHALMTTQLTDASGAPLGDALDLVEQVDSVRGQVIGASGDHQFRLFVRLKETAIDTLFASQQFKRAPDNTTYHKGYPVNFRGLGTPSIQVSAALDGRRADIDVDYRKSSFPAAIFNGHLTASNSDVRAGNNDVRHSAKWSGLQNWWRNFFGISLGGPADDPMPAAMPFQSIPPRAGKKPVDVMTEDFLKAWLIEGDIKAAMSYVSERAYACLAVDAEDPDAFDRGMAPYVLMRRLKVAHDKLRRSADLADLVAGVRLVMPSLRLIQQPHTQFAVYDVADDLAAEFDCESRLSVGVPRIVKPEFGHYYGAVFYIKGHGPKKPVSLALLWARENGYLKIVSWQVEPEADDTPVVAAPATTTPVRIDADASLVEAAHGFLQSWLVRKDYDAAFGYLAPKSYGCYDLFRPPGEPAATSVEDAGRKLRAALERSGNKLTGVRTLEDVIEGVPPVHPQSQIMEHAYSRAFSLTRVPTAMAEAYSCDARARGVEVTGPLPSVYGEVFGMTLRFRTQSGEPAVLRVAWVREGGAWRIVTYDIEVP